MFFLYVFYFITFCSQSIANVDLNVVIEKITTELGSGRLTVSSYLHYTAEHCLENLEKSLTVGQESLNCYTNAYKSLDSTQNATLSKSEKQKSSEEENWELLCKVWPLLSTCHRKTTVPSTDQCYQELSDKRSSELLMIPVESDMQSLKLLDSSENLKRGSDALSFTDAYISFQCKNINRTVGVLELARPRRLICFQDLKEFINNCSKKAVLDEFESTNAHVSFKRLLLLIGNCYETEYTKYAEYCSAKNDNAGKVIPFIKDMFAYIDNDMFKLEKDNVHEIYFTNNSETHTKKSMDENEIEETKRNINSKIKDEILKDFLTNIIIPDETEQNVSNDDIGDVTDRPFPIVTHKEQEDHGHPDHDHTTTTPSPNENTSPYSHNKSPNNGAITNISTSGILIKLNFLFIILKYACFS